MATRPKYGHVWAATRDGDPAIEEGSNFSDEGPYVTIITGHTHSDHRPPGDGTGGRGYSMSHAAALPYLQGLAAALGYRLEKLPEETAHAD